MDNFIKYMEGYKYQLNADYTTRLDLTGYTVDSEYISLTSVGVFTIRKGYAWDGASGPTIDTKSSMRGSLEHDALYQLMRQELLPISVREFADNRFKETCIKDGMTKVRADIWFTGVRLFAEAAAEPNNKKQVLIAP